MCSVAVSRANQVGGRRCGRGHVPVAAGRVAHATFAAEGVRDRVVRERRKRAEKRK